MDDDYADDDDYCDNCVERRSTTQYGGDLVTWCIVTNVCNMSAKNNSDSEYYGRDLVTWCNGCNMLAKNNRDNEYCRRVFVTQNKK